MKDHNKKSWLRKYMDFIITDNPAELKLQDIKPGVLYAFDRIDDEKIIYDFSPDRKFFKKYGVAGYLSFIAGLFWMRSYLFDDFISTFLILMVLGIILFIPSTIFLLYAFFAPGNKKIIFNRLKGTVQLPGILWDKPHIIKFNELHAVLSVASVAAPGMQISARRTRSWWDRAGGGVNINIGGKTPWESWSLWVWYMDKNRPLPPGEALDPYRKKDYARRKSDGFPRPLYPSVIPRKRNSFFPL
jgi:hypothetical protein